MSKFFGLYIALGLCVAAAAAWWFFFHQPNQIRNYPSSGTDIILFGDSLASGTGVSEGQDLASNLARLVGVPVVNLGRSGDTTADALLRIGVLDDYRPKVVIIVLGGNDYLRRLDMNVAFSNLGKIISAVEDRGAIALLVGLKLNPLVGNFDSEFRDLAEFYKTAYVPDALYGIFGNQSLMADEIHPNAAGYELMAERIAPVLQKLIE